MSLLRPRYLATITLLCLLALFQWQIWIGRGSYPSVELMRQEVSIQHSSNELISQDNERLAGDIVDLREGHEMMEEMARKELGMIKPNEIYVQYTNP